MLYEDYVYGSVSVTQQTISDLQTLIASNDVIYFNYSVDVSTAPKVKVGVPQELLESVPPQYIFNPATSNWRLHILSSPDNALTQNVSYVEGIDTLDIPGYVWAITNILPEDAPEPSLP